MLYAEKSLLAPRPETDFHAHDGERLAGFRLVGDHPNDKYYAHAGSSTVLQGKRGSYSLRLYVDADGIPAPLLADFCGWLGKMLEEVKS